METETTTAPPRRNDEYWCHQCATEITPMLVPHPMCPNCHSEFVELIEVDNDPRSFMGQGEHDHDHEHDEHEHEHDHEHEHHGHGHSAEGSEQITLEDLLRLIHVIGNQRGPLTPRQQQQQEGGGEAQARPLSQTRNLPGQFPGFSSQSTALENEETEEHAAGEAHSDATATQRNEALSPALSALLGHLGLELHFSAEPATPGQAGFGGLGGLFNMVGNPGDYVFGQGGLDDVITHLMELQNRQSGPVGASEDAIESIPRHILTDEDIAANTECSVCKDEFVKEDPCLQLPCKHIFHDECIKPWLKTSATCPTCRFSLLSENETGASQESSVGN
ncbi:hypothetical protein BG004_008310 [Podila humilis]|nr:hypothetical protein BG004_008310 [Podila humilis]